MEDRIIEILSDVDRPAKSAIEINDEYPMPDFLFHLKLYYN